MRIEIIFHTSGKPKVHEDAEDIYTKGGFCCIQLQGGLIMKYPLCNVFSVAHHHAPHLGTTRRE